MPERSILTQRIQIGVEATYGTPVAASKRFASLDFEVGPSFEAKTFRGSGYKVPTIVSPMREWAKGTAKGVPTYTEIVYLLASVLRTPPTPTQVNPPSGAAYRWTFEPTSNAIDPFTSYTLEYGDSTIAHRVAGLVFTSFTLDVAPDQVECSADWLGMALEHPFTLTGSGVTELTNVPVLGKQCTLFVADSPAGLSNTANKVARGFSVSFKQPERYGPVWALDQSQTSFVALSEKPTEPTIEIELEADAAGMSYLANARAGDTRFVRVQALGPVIEASTQYELTIDLAMSITDISALRARDNLVAVSYTGTVRHDPTWNKYLSVTVVNRQSAL